MTTEKRSRPGLIQPLMPHRFRVTDCPMNITQNVRFLTIDFMAKNITMAVSATVEPQSFQDLMQFSKSVFFTIEMLDGSADGVIYGLRPMGLKIREHKCELNYGATGVLNHHFMWEFSSVELMVPNSGEKSTAPTDNFMTPAEAIAQVQDPLTKKDRGAKNK
jgi:hypothetical protein